MIITAIKTSYNGKKLKQNTTINNNLSGSSSTTITSPSGKTGTTSISWPGLGSSSSKKSSSSSTSSSSSGSSNATRYYDQFKANGGNTGYSYFNDSNSLYAKNRSSTSTSASASNNYGAGEKPTYTNTAGSYKDIASPDYTDLSSIATPEYISYDSIDKPEYTAGEAPDLTVDNSESQSWKAQLNNMYNQIVNRGAFKYDQSSDPLYQQYAEMYQNNANLAMQNTVGQVSSMTGGYGNSYAETAGQSMYNQYMDNLNSKALELYNAAENTYNNETSRLMNNYSLASNQYSNAVNEEQTAYEKLLEQYNIENALRQEQNDYNMNMYELALQSADSQNSWNQNMYGYQLSNAQAMNALKQGDWQTNLSNYWNERQMDYDQYRDSVSDWYNDRDFGYQDYRDTQAYDFEQQQFAYQQQQDAQDREDEYFFNGFNTDGTRAQWYTDEQAREDAQAAQDRADEYFFNGFKTDGSRASWYTDEQAREDAQTAQDRADEYFFNGFKTDGSRASWYTNEQNYQGQIDDLQSQVDANNLAAGNTNRAQNFITSNPLPEVSADGKSLIFSNGTSTVYSATTGDDGTVYKTATEYVTAKKKALYKTIEKSNMTDAEKIFTINYYGLTDIVV